jgi:hypothetical protein
MRWAPPKAPVNEGVKVFLIRPVRIVLVAVTQKLLFRPVTGRRRQQPGLKVKTGNTRLPQPAPCTEV